MNRILTLIAVFILLNVSVQGESTELKNNSIIGEWVTVDFVKDISFFDPPQRCWKGKLHLRGLSFQADSTVQCYSNNNQSSVYRWEPGKVHATSGRPALYQIKEIGNCEYLFYEWISGDVTIRGMKPYYYVLKKGEFEKKHKVTPSGNFRAVKPIDNVNYYDDVRWKDLSSIKALNIKLIRSLRFNQDTVWPDKAVGSNTIGKFADKIMNAATNPGLGVRKLHKMGITGKDVNVAIIDQPLYQDHPEFSGKIAAYHDVGCGTNSSMHGPAVASLLVGENCGTAPDAKVYYVAAPSWTKDTAFQAQALEWIIEQNRQLPDGQKIRVVSVSAAPSGEGSPFDKNNEMWDIACRKAEDEEIMVLDCTQHHGFISPAHFTFRITESPATCGLGSPKNPWQNPPKELAIFVPTCPRTTAEEYDKGVCRYVYWGQGGLSWAIPYTAGVLAMGWQIWPEVTPEEMKDLLFKSAYTNKDGAKIINPPGFIALVKKTKMQ